MAPAETQGFQKNPSGNRRNRTSVVCPEAAGSESSRFSVSSVPCAVVRQG